MVSTHSSQLTERPPGDGLAQPLDGLSNAFNNWRKHRLDIANNAAVKQSHTVSFDESGQAIVSNSLLNGLCDEVCLHGYAFYQFAEDGHADTDATRQKVNQFYAAIGLQDSDTGVLHGNDQLSLLENSSDPVRRRFIPFSDKAMNWHTDGYYNSLESTIKSFCLHCIQPARSGGELSVLDPELLLIALYERKPETVALLAHKQAMLIPASKDELGHDRPDRSGPVFDIDHDGTLLTRLTARQKFIAWRTPATEQAAQLAIDLVNENPQWQFTVRLAAGQGIITRNVLHCRSAFSDDTDGPSRQMLRGRYARKPTSNRSETSPKLT